MQGCSKANKQFKKNTLSSKLCPKNDENCKEDVCAGQHLKQTLHKSIKKGGELLRMKEKIHSCVLNLCVKNMKFKKVCAKMSTNPAQCIQKFKENKFMEEEEEEEEFIFSRMQNRMCVQQDIFHSLN